MPNYANSIIYTIKIKDDNSVYIGSTTRNLNKRLNDHKNRDSNMLGKYINEKYNGDWSVVFIEEYEKYPCSCQKELYKKEGEIIKLFKDNQEYNCLNKNINGRTRQEYHQEYYHNNKEHIDNKNKKWFELNKQKSSEYSLKCYYKNHDETKEKQKERARKYREENREKYNQYMREYNKKKEL